MVELKRCEIEDAKEIFDMQVLAFADLLAKYQDNDTNPGAEELGDTVKRLNDKRTHYFWIVADGQKSGILRIKKDSGICVIKNIFLKKELRGKGYATQAIKKAEELFDDAVSWELETILEETELCEFYENLGFKRTGKLSEVKPGMTIVYYSK